MGKHELAGHPLTRENITISTLAENKINGGTLKKKQCSTAGHKLARLG